MRSFLVIKWATSMLKGKYKTDNFNSTRNFVKNSLVRKIREIPMVYAIWQLQFDKKYCENSLVEKICENANRENSYLFIIFRNWIFILLMLILYLHLNCARRRIKWDFFLDIQTLCLMFCCGLCFSDMHNAHLSSLQVTAILEKE